MTQTMYNGTLGVDVFDASSASAADIVVFRGIGAGDLAIGGAGNDRFSAVAGATLHGGAGADQFRIA